MSQINRARSITFAAWMFGMALARIASGQGATAEADSLFNVGVGQQARGDLDAAARSFERSIAAGAQGFVPHLRLARVRALQRNVKAAMAELDGIAKSSFAPQFSHLYLTQQPDFDAIRSDPGFVRLTKQLENARFPCRENPEAHQLDFWLGQWVVSSSGGGTGAHSDISATVEHCAIIEKWTDQFGGTGTSMNFFDPGSRLWRQIYVADGGTILDYAGTFHDGAMWFDSVRPIIGNGPKTRLVFHRVGADTVRQVFESSTDDGRSWKSTWEGVYVRLR